MTEQLGNHTGARPVAPEQNRYISFVSNFPVSQECTLPDPSGQSEGGRFDGNSRDAPRIPAFQNSGCVLEFLSTILADGLFEKCSARPNETISCNAPQTLSGDGK